MPYDHARQLWRRIRYFVVFRVLHADDTPHRIAMGVAVGLFAGWIPTIGMQTIIALALATLVRANKLIPVLLVWISNPITALPILYVNWVVGRFIMPGRDELRMNEAYIRLRSIIEHSPGPIDVFFSPSAWRQFMTIFIEMGIELWIGSVAVGIFLGISGYFTTLHAVIYLRERRKLQREKRVRRLQERMDATMPKHADDATPNA
jgi:uncharacterized protein (DUF2062 family)